MRKILNLLKKNIVKLLVCLLLLVFTLNKNKDVNKETTYHLNTKSKKVHSLDCGVGKRAKEKNKKLVTDTKISDISTNLNILKASEKAINNYKNNYERINVFGGILQYPCELMEKNNYYYEAGDDCVRYWFTVLNSIDLNFVYRISNTARKKWSSINTNLIYKNDKNFVEAMIKNGFKIYDSITERNTENVKIEKLTPSFNLEKGDVVCRKGHVQIYIGNNETDNFGWGKVSRNFPANYNFSLTESEVNSLDEVTVNDTNNEKKYIVKVDKGYGTEVYTRVYRYVGGAENEE